MRRSNRRKHREQPTAEINITNLVDVTMTLLIVFMIVAPMLKQGLEIELPTSIVAEKLENDDQVILIESDKSGAIHINQEEVLLGSVQDTIRGLLSSHGSVVPVQIRMDKDVPYGFFVGLCGEIRAAGVESIAVELIKNSAGSSNG